MKSKYEKIATLQFQTFSFFCKYFIYFSNHLVFMQYFYIHILIYYVLMFSCLLDDIKAFNIIKKSLFQTCFSIETMYLIDLYEIKERSHLSGFRPTCRS